MKLFIFSLLILLAVSLNGQVIPVPGSNLIFCVQSVSYCNGKIKVVTSIETRERKHAGNQSPRIEDVVILEDCYTLEVGHFLSVNKENTEPIDSHSHE